MQIISNTLEPVLATWEDPGDYPNSLAQSPLPSYQYVDSVEGEIVLELESSDFTEGVFEIETDLPHEIRVTRWEVAYRPGTSFEGLGMKVVLTVVDFEAERVESAAAAVAAEEED